MSETEIHARLCVRSAWTRNEQLERRRRAAAMQERLLRSIVSRSVQGLLPPLEPQISSGKNNEHLPTKPSSGNISHAKSTMAFHSLDA